jgi:hypothetical protein
MEIMEEIRPTTTKGSLRASAKSPFRPKPRMVYETTVNAQLVVLSDNRSPLTRERRMKMLIEALLLEEGLKMQSRRRRSVSERDLRAIRTIRGLK